MNQPPPITKQYRHLILTPEEVAAYSQPRWRKPMATDGENDSAIRFVHGSNLFRLVLDEVGRRHERYLRSESESNCLHRTPRPQPKPPVQVLPIETPPERPDRRKMALLRKLKREART